MGPYPPLETGENHRLQHVAEVRSCLEKEQDFRASLYKKIPAGGSMSSMEDTTLSVASLGLAASVIGLLSTIIVVPVAVGLQAGAIVCGLLGAGRKFIGQRLGVKARKHDQIRVLAESKLNTVADRISTALTDDKISKEEFRLILSVDKYDQMKAEIHRGCQNQGSLSEIEKSSCCTSWETRQC